MTTSATRPRAVPTSSVGIQSWWRSGATGLEHAVNGGVGDPSRHCTAAGVVLNGDDGNVGEEQEDDDPNRGPGCGGRGEAVPRIDRWSVLDLGHDRLLFTEPVDEVRMFAIGVELASATR